MGKYLFIFLFVNIYSSIDITNETEKNLFAAIYYYKNNKAFKASQIIFINSNSHGNLNKPRAICCKTRELVIAQEALSLKDELTKEELENLTSKDLSYIGSRYFIRFEGQSIDDIFSYFID